MRSRATHTHESDGGPAFQRPLPNHFSPESWIHVPRTNSDRELFTRKGLSRSSSFSPGTFKVDQSWTRRSSPCRKGIWHSGRKVSSGSTRCGPETGNTQRVLKDLTKPLRHFASRTLSTRSVLLEVRRLTWRFDLSNLPTTDRDDNREQLAQRPSCPSQLGFQLVHS